MAKVAFSGKVFDLLDCVNVVKDSLATREYIPAMAHLCFRGNIVQAFNEETAQESACPKGFNLSGGVRGSLLVGLLQSSRPKQSLEVSANAENLELRLGKNTKLTLPMLPAADFLFDFPKEVDEVEIKHSVHETLAAAIECGILAADQFSGIPEHMSSFWYAAEGGTVILSTNRVNFVRSKVKTQLSGLSATPRLLPIAFCKLLISALKEKTESKCFLGAYETKSKKTGKLSGGMVFRRTDGYKLYGRFLSPGKAADYEKEFQSAADPKSLKYTPLPRGFDNAVKRAAVLLQDQQASQRLISDHSVVVKLEEGRITIKTETPAGNLEDECTLANEFEFQGKPGTYIGEIANLDKALNIPHDPVKGEPLSMAVGKGVVGFKSFDKYCTFLAADKPAE